ncbi:MAG TPA: PQQ-binding-like beta-propeller repeat protein [Solirubrobacteraceae bacterium]|jgi:hypothetical protein
MRVSRVARLALLLAACAALGACGSSVPGEISTPTVSVLAVPAATGGAGARRLLDWPEFGLDAQRSDVSEQATGITAANLGWLRRASVAIPGTVDSSPIYLHGISAAGASRDVILATTTYGRTVAIDASSAKLLWTFTPPGFARWAGSAQITTASPIADPDRRFVYAASPDGMIHKLALTDGRESAGWPVRITRDATHEKIAAALNIAAGNLIATTGGYFGDAPPYQGHVVLIDRSSGRVRRIFNTLCANRRELIVPSSCAASDAAILSRSGAVVEPGARRLLLDTGNGPWNGTTDLGDSVIELTLPSLAVRQAFTPTNQAQLNESDTDLGSSAPALLGGDRVVVAGKDGILRVLVLSRLDGHPPSGARPLPLGGEVQSLSTPGGAELFTTPAVWRHGRRTTIFVADERGTAAYVLRGGRLFRAWQNANPGTSPVMAGGLLYVYDPAAGGIYVYRPGSPRALAKLAGSPGHWNSPIALDGHVVEPEGNGNDHRQLGSIEIFSTP